MKYIKKVVILFFLFLLGVLLFLLYGPFSFFRDFIITTSMMSKSHRYIATTLYSDSVISSVLDNNYVVEEDGFTNPDLIDMNSKILFKNKYDRQILKHNKKNLYKLINIDGIGYKGYLVAIYDSSKVRVAVSDKIFESGEDILSVSRREKSIVSINASGFYDPNWNSNGAIPHGTVIKDSKLISSYSKAIDSGGFIGFDHANKLVLGKYDVDDALNIYRDAVEFGPFLLVNGRRVKVVGNGGFGIAPRTAIGQRRDGIVLFLVIDGRTPSSIGASISDLMDIMEKYGAYNAANLDGGSSTGLVIHNKIINKIATSEKSGRNIPTFFVVNN